LESGYEEDRGSEAPVLVIGSAGVDFVGRVTQEFSTGTSVPAEIRTSWGGVARNVAENLIRLGQPVTLLSAIGDDEIGDQLLEHTAEAGVDTRYVLRSETHPTGAYLAVIGMQGQLHFALDDMRAASELTSDYIRQHKALFKESSALFVDANVTPKALRTALHQARLARLPVYADPTSATLAVRLKPFLPRLAMITPNKAEATALCGVSFQAENAEQGIQVAQELVSEGVALAIITLAEFGVSYATSQTSGHIPAIRTEIVDPTGAGDALTAAVIFARLNDIPTDDAVRLGVSAASLTLKHPGTVYPNLSLEELYDQLII
jgi:pseudouridine kinase